METIQEYETDEQSIQKEKQNSIRLELGDIIEIIAPANDAIHEITAIITYIDFYKIKLINVSNSKFYQLNIDENGYFTDESIESIYLLNRSNDKGFARQNNLLVKTWVDIHFSGEIPVIISGEITNLEEDMIEITTYPELHTIYLNFAYQGIPESIPIEKIVIRQKPESLKNLGSLSLLREQLEEGEIFEQTDKDVDMASMMFTDSGESIIHIPEKAKPDEDIRKSLNDLYIDANSIVFGERLEQIAQVVEVPEGQQRYGIDAQVNDLMDELLSTIPNSQRTKMVLDNIHLLIERFKQLRSEFSKFDANENVYDIKTVGPYYKPLIQHLLNFDKKLQWILPVVKNRRKIYLSNDEVTIETNDSSVDKMASNLRYLETLQESYYKNNKHDQSLTYSTMYKQINNWITPVDEPYDKESCITNTQVMANIEAIVDNLEDFYSSVYTSSGIKKKQYVVQKYNLGLSYLEEQVMKTGKSVYIRSPLTNNDNISVKSILMMPYPVVNFSKIELPNTNILQKATLHQNYFLLFRLMRKNIDIIPHVIGDLSKEFDYESMNKESNVSFLSGIHEFILDDNLYVDEEDKFNKFLEVIIPKTKLLIKLVRKYVKDKVSYVDVVQQLEPFMVYTNDITYTQYKDIRYFMKERIREFKQKYAKDFTDFSVIKNAKYDIAKKMKPILRLLSEKKDFADSFFNSYKFLSNEKLDTTLSSNEILSRVVEMDNGNLYYNVLTSIMISLMTPDKLMGILSEAKLDDITDMEKIKPNDCSQKYLAKRYTSLSELQKDNNLDEIYFSKEFDDTPYSIVKKYENDKKRMLPDLFLEFLTESLIHNHDCPTHIAKELAKTLISGKKIIKDGDYAILEIKPKLPASVDETNLTDIDKKSIENEAEVRKRIQYFRRLKNNWVSEQMEDNSFIDTNTLFCNISKDCFKNTKNNVCESNDEAAIRLKEIAKKSMLNEFDKRYTINIEELETELDKNIHYHLKMLKRLQVLNNVKLYKANNLAFEIGNLATIHDLIVSPYINARELIMGQDDFSKKQYDICRFVDTFCREPMLNELEEHPAWFYCKETNTKLFPRSLHSLAEAFVSGENYQERLAEVCHKYGTLSDDEDSVVDKYSGYVLTKRELSNEEGFDELGRKIQSRDILEKDLATVLMESLYKKKTRIFESETTETIYNVFSTICSNIDIPTESIEEFILRVSNEIIQKEIFSKEKYQQKSEQKFKKTGKYFEVSYADYRNETTIIIISCVLLIAVQTAIPSFQPKRTFPGCLRSFSGYPMTGVEDLTGIKYIACVLNKTKSSISPWISIQQYSTDVLSKRIKSVLEGQIMNRNDINDLYTQKREYMLLNPLLTSPAEHNISKWLQFLPPIVNFSVMKKLKNISTDFKSEFIETLKKGSDSQHELMGVLKGKVILFGYAVIESINDIVKDKDMLLKTSSSIPFLENACCNESVNLTNPILYFNEENNNIIIYLRNAKYCGEIISFTKKISRAGILYHPFFTGIKHKILSNGQLEETIYATVIHYCNFDKQLPIPENLKFICNEKPALYNSKWSMTEKMEFLKKNGKRFSVENLQQLMSIVNNENVLNIEPDYSFTQIDILQEVIEKLDMMNSNVVESRLRQHLLKVIGKYDPLVMTDKSTPELNDLTNYLINTNNKLYKEIMGFFDSYGNLSNAEYGKVSMFLKNIDKWNLDIGMKESKNYFDDGLYNVTQFIKNIIHNASKVYPSFILNDADLKRNVPVHWNLSTAHVSDISRFVDKYYDKLEKFKEDSSLVKLLRDIDIKLVDLSLFTSSIPIKTEVIKEIMDEEKNMKLKTFHSLFDKQTLYLLFTYCLYSLLYEYVLASDDVELLTYDKQETKINRRTVVENNGNISNALQGFVETLDEKIVDDANDLSEINIIQRGNQKELKQRVSSLLLAFLDIEKDNKETIDLSYKQIMQKVGRSKEKEKQDIIKYLGDMSNQERKIEDMFKNYRLGRWNVGQQKGLVEYDKETYNRERNDLIGQLYEESNNGFDNVALELLDIYEIEKQEKHAEEKDIFNEMNNIQGLPENFMDGEYYEEDHDPTDFYND